ncbi:glycosyltransferase family 4 protein [Reichenbachiella sp.]|uniref:glycosyltransferase family 4 protein n=1 Tax=Reichenbachiella sp. TaxID=2184521 RepID=UPI003BB12BED
MDEAMNNKPIIGMVFHGEYPTHPRIENQALYLLSEGAEIHLFCVTYQKQNAGIEIYKGIHVHRYYCKKWMYKVSALAYTIPLYHSLIKGKLLDFMSRVKPDVIHLHNMYLAEPVYNLASKQRIPVILDIHENVPEIMKFYPHLQSGLGKLLIKPSVWKRKEEEFILKSDGIIVVTSDAKNELEQRTGAAPSKTLVLPNFTDPSFEKAAYDFGLINKFKGNFNAIYVGDTGKRRGIESVIKAIPLILKEISNFHLIVVGASNNDQALRDLAKQMNVDQHISFEGWQPESILSDYIYLSDIGICPLLRNIHHDTTYANKLFQYAMLGKPILASNCTAQKNLIENEKWGLIHESEDSLDFAKQFIDLYNNTQLRKQCGENGAKAIASKYNYPSSEFGIAYYQKLIR